MLILFLFLPKRYDDSNAIVPILEYMIHQLRILSQFTYIRVLLPQFTRYARDFKNVKILKFQKHFVNTNMRALALAAIAKLLVACARACMVYAMVYACTVVEVD